MTACGAAGLGSQSQGSSFDELLPHKPIDHPSYSPARPPGPARCPLVLVRRLSSCACPYLHMDLLHVHAEAEQSPPSSSLDPSRSSERPGPDLDHWRCLIAPALSRAPLLRSIVVGVFVNLWTLVHAASDNLQIRMLGHAWTCGCSWSADLCAHQLRQHLPPHALVLSSLAAGWRGRRGFRP